MQLQRRFLNAFDKSEEQVEEAVNDFRKTNLEKTHKKVTTKHEWIE